MVVGQGRFVVRDGSRDNIPEVDVRRVAEGTTSERCSVMILWGMVMS
jgi:hypothetical protein